MMIATSRNEAKILGLPRYKTGAPCMNWHVDERFTAAGNCVECSRQFYWIKRGLDPRPKQTPMTAEELVLRKREYAKSYAVRHPERVRLAEAKWRANNKEQIREASQLRYWSDPEKFRNRSRASRMLNIERARATHREWVINNPTLCRLYEHTRRARKAGQKLSKDIVPRLLRLQKNRCLVCRLGLGQAFHIDHIMPLALGGSNTDENVQLLCKHCNHSKHKKHPVDFMQSRGFLL